MGRTFNQIKNSVLGKNFDVNNYSKTKKNGRTFNEIKNDVMSGKSDFSLVKTELEKRIGIDTLTSDISSMVKTIEDIGTNWQTQERMVNTRSTIESMQTRLSALKDYQKLFGNKDTDDIDMLQSNVRDSLDGWDDLSKQYGKYKDANAYTSEKNKLTELYSMDSKQLKGKKGVAYTTSDGYNIKWEDLYNDAYSREYEADVDKTIDVAKSGAYKKKDAKLSTTWNGYAVVGDEDAYLYNYVNGDKEARDYGTLTNVHMSGTYDFLKNKHLTEDEKMRFNALWETQGPEKAKEYLGLLDSDLRQRRVEHEKMLYAKDATESPFGTSVASVIQNLGNNALALPFLAMDYAEDGNIDPNSSLYTGRRQVQTTRSKVEGNIESDAGQFFYRHGMNIADNLASRAVSLGVGSGVASQFLMSSGAAVDTVLDAKERGLSDGQALSLGAISGAAEWFFESKGFESWVDTKTLTKSAWRYFVNNLKTELVGEVFTEGANDIADIFIAQDLNSLNTEYQSYLASGLSAKESFIKVVGGVASRYADVVAGTILSTGAMSGPGATIGGIQQHSFNKNMGKTIKANERVGEVFDIASNPEVASAYEAYTRYANKGINADNISDAQLGRLYSMAKADAVETLGSRKATEEQKVSAVQTLEKLSKVKSENTVRKEAQKLNIGEETYETKSGAKVDIKDLKVKGDEITFATEKGEVSIEDATLTQNDAEVITYARQIAQNEGEAISQLFIDQYDGETNAEEYATSFNLTMEYAKNNFTYDTILSHKGSLSTDAVKAIYNATIVNEAMKKDDNLKNLSEKYGNNMTIKGKLEDSIIDYNSTTKDGSKVNWNELTSTQRSAIKFLRLFSKATGVNVRLIKSEIVDGKHKGENGSYNPDTNTIEIDVYAGRIDAKSVKDSIIPTLAHEVTHWMKAKSNVLYNSLREDVMKTLSARTGLSEETLIANEIRKLDKNHPEKKHTVDEAIDELVARSCEDMLSNSNEARKLLNKMSASEQKRFMKKVQETFDNLIQWVNDLLSLYKSDSREAKLLREYKHDLKRISKQWDAMLAEAIKNNQALEKSGAFSQEITSIGSTELSDLSEAVGTDGEKLFQYRAMVEDEDIYRAMLLEHKDVIGITNEQITELFDTIDKAVDIISQNLEALDYAWDVDVDDRAFAPVNPNSDSLYKVSLDFSTLCRKRLLQQTIQSTLQSALEKNLSTEESIAIRDELIKIQEEGRKIEVACALCYVESARMKSPKQINKFLNNRENIIKEFFANRSGGSIQEKIVNEELKARKEIKKANPDGYFGKNDMKLDVLTAPKSHMKKADADYIRAEGKKAKASYKLTEHEQAELDAAMEMSVDDFTSAKGLENLAKTHPDLFDTYTSFVRNATHSKGIENDTWWRAGDSDAIGDNLIAQMNAENGLRSQSWSDFQVIHLLDYIAATIELSTKGAKRQSYTKVPDYVKLLGNTGDRINMSLIPERVFNGKLSYDGVEGMAYDIAKQLRDEYHETVGTICIGINNEQIRLLLEDTTIDMVIPYHHSSMSKAVRKLMHIPAWETYQNYQSEKKLSDAEAKARAKEYGVELKQDAKWQKAPNFSEWFNLDEARQIAKLENENPSDMKAYKKYGKMYGGYMAMQNAANNYLKLCAERGLAPKFSNEKSDFTQDANYWKLLIDRKMVDNVTGEIIEQKPIKPIFSEKSILEILNDELARYPQVKADQEYATRKVTEKFLSGDMKVDKSTLDAIKKPIDNVTEVNILESSREAYTEEEYLNFGWVRANDVLSAGEYSDFTRKFADAVEQKFYYHKSKRGEYIIPVSDINEAIFRGTENVLVFAEGKIDNLVINSIIRIDEYDEEILNGVRGFIYVCERRGIHQENGDSFRRYYADDFKFSQARQTSVLSSTQNSWDNQDGKRNSMETQTTSDEKVVYSTRDDVGDLSSLPADELLRDFGRISADVSGYELWLSRYGRSKLNRANEIESKLTDSKTKFIQYGDYIIGHIDEYTPDGLWLSTQGIISTDIERKNFTRENFIDVVQPIIDKLKEQLGYVNEKNMSYDEGLENVIRSFFSNELGFKDVSPKSSEDINHDSEDLWDNVLFSDREDTSPYDIMGETERILKENEKFKAEIERLKERLKIERQVTNGNYFNENQLGAAAGHLRNISRSLISKDKLVDSLKDVYSYIAHSPEVAWDVIFEKCYNIAEDMLTEAKPLTMVNDYYKQILSDIRNARISLSESQKNEAQNIFDKHWNRYFFGRTTITDKGTPIEALWQEWSSLYPGIFDADISDGDMIGELYDILNNLKDASETVIEYDAMEQKRWLAREIYNQYWNVSPIRTTADKYDKKIRLLNFEHRRVMEEFREEYNSRLKAQHKADMEHSKERQSKIREEYNSKLKAQRKADREKAMELYNKIRERKKKEIALAKQHGRDMMTKYKENAERKTVQQRITANSLSLSEMLLKNSKDKHIPEIMREPVVNLLQAIDFSSKRLLEKGEPTQKDISLSKSLGKVKDMMVKATNAHNELVELYGHGLDDDIEKMVDSVDNIMRSVGDNEFVLNKMTLTDLQTLDKMVKTIKHAVNKLNKFHTVNHAKGIANLSQESVLYLDSLGKGKIYDGKRGAIKKLLDWGNALPYYVFKRYGSGGMKVYEALQDGWDKFAFNTKKIIDYAHETYSSKEVKEWGEEVRTFNILIPASEMDMASDDYVPQYQEVQLTVPQIMSMYCLNKREQARGHLFKGGIRVADFKDKKGKIVSQSEGVIFTEKDVREIFDTLTDRQKEVADKLQEFMNTICADWGNEVSMARFGYKAFDEENYFPIQSDKNNLAVNDETEQPNSLFKLLNMSFTKSTIEKANNRIVISDIFDVFAQHTSDMSKYNALALPVLDSFKWYNYTEKEPIAEGTFKTSGVKQSIEKAFGKDGQNYFTTFLKDINGQQEVSRDTLGKGFFSNAKIAAVGANLRVVLLQPTSYARASAVIDNKYLMKALGHKPKIKRAETHCGIALWKSLGYYDTNIQRGVEAQIKHADTWKDKATEWSMKGAEIADKVTWGYLWNACELEVRDTRKDLKVGSKEFNDAIGKRLREVIYATQVVDSTMTRSQMMRSTDGRDKFLTAFASEPTLSYNMLQDAYMELSLDARHMGKKEAWKKNGKRMARIVVAYTITNALAALVESGFDVFREDDDEEMDMAIFMKFYLKNFASDMSISAKIPYIKELHSMIQGFGSSRTDTQWMEEMTKAVTTWYKIFNGKGNASTAIRYSIKGISDLSGLPFYNVYRDTMAALDKLDLFTAEDLNEMFEDFFD